MAETPTIQELASKAFLKPQQAAELQDNINRAESLLRTQGTMASTYGIDVNADEVEKVLTRNKQTLEMGTPQQYDGTTKNKLHRVMQALETSIAHDMPTVDDMERPTPANIDKHMAWEQAHKNEILAWRSIRRILDPTNPHVNFTNVETLRSNTPPKGDPRRYWTQFDNIQWEDDIEDELVTDIGDAEYLTFLELRAAQWAKPNILRRLEWNERRYAAAVERFRRSGVISDRDAEQALQETAEEAEGAPEEHSSDPYDLRPTRKAAERSPRVRVTPRAKRKLSASDVWPMPECRERDMSVAALARMTDIKPIRMTNVCLSTKGGKPWTDDERDRIEKALAEWDAAHAFVAKQEQSTVETPAVETPMAVSEPERAESVPLQPTPQHEHDADAVTTITPTVVEYEQAPS